MYLKINQKKITSASLALIVKSLKKGEVIVYPTDTIYGLGCLASNAKAIKKIKLIKKRDSNKPLLILVSSLSMAKRYSIISKKQELIIKKIWAKNRPTSIILQHRNLLPHELVSEKMGLAIRLPKSDFLRKMIKMVRVPIVSTSFNISGEPVWNRVDSLTSLIQNKSNPELVIDGGVLKNKASKLVDARGSKIKIIRK